MSSNIITVRLNTDEVNMLDFCRLSDIRGDVCRGELFRLLLRREYNRRKALGAPTPSDYQTDFRQGRPRKA